MTKNFTLQKKLMLTLLILFISAGFIIAGVITVYFSLFRNAKIESVQADEMKKMKSNLKGYVDLAVEVMATNYSLVNDNAYLEKRYGPRLRNVIDIGEKKIKELITQVNEGEMSEASAYLPQSTNGVQVQVRSQGRLGQVWSVIKSRWHDVAFDRPASNERTEAPLITAGGVFVPPRAYQSANDPRLRVHKTYLDFSDYTRWFTPYP